MVAEHTQGASARVVVGLGANLGHAPRQLHTALQSLVQLSDGSELLTSDLHTSPAMLHPDNPAPQPDYTNLVASFVTRVQPPMLLALARRIEARMGRDFSLPVWSARPVDIDILAWQNLRWHSHELCIPHPGASQREFVQRPWAELAGLLNICLPGLKNPPGSTT